MDKVIDKIVALGVPGLVLLVALNVVGFCRGRGNHHRISGPGRPDWHVGRNCPAWGAGADCQSHFPITALSVSIVVLSSE